MVSSLLFTETLSGVCTLVPQMSFTFLLFEPLITRAIREREKAERQTAATAWSHNSTASSGDRSGGPTGRLNRWDGDRDRDRDRQSTVKEKEAMQTARYFSLVEKLRLRLDELREKERKDREGAVKDEEDEWSQDREKLQQRDQQQKEREKPSRRKDHRERRHTTTRLSTQAEKDRERDRVLDQGREKDRRERQRADEREDMSSYHFIAAASTMAMEDLDDYKASPSPAFVSPNTSPATHSPSSQ